MRTVVFDIETKNVDWNGGNVELLDIAMVCIWDSHTDSYLSFLDTELPKLWPILEETDVLVGYNSDHFDIPLLNKYYAGDLTKLKSVDLLKEIKNASGRRFKLDSVAKATLGRGKIADGLEAVSWWQEGNIEKVREYCIDDVRLTKEIYEFALKNKKILYLDWGGEKREVKLDVSDWKKKDTGSITHTLPF